MMVVVFLMDSCAKRLLGTWAIVTRDIPPCSLVVVRAGFSVDLGAEESANAEKTARPFRGWVPGVDVIHFGSRLLPMPLQSSVLWKSDVAAKLGLASAYHARSKDWTA
jgi:hypothetical protein